MNIRLIFTLTISLLLLSQAYGQADKSMDSEHPDIHKILVQEVLQTSSYTYILAEENGDLQWIAIPKMEASPGEVYYYKGGLNMGEFQSKELDRTFDSIIFLNGLVSPDLVESGKMKQENTGQDSEDAKVTTTISVDPTEGGISISELYAKREKYANKVVRIRGEVTRYNAKIMGKNWIHLQDGSSGQDNYDLTLTTSEEASVGDLITVEGIIMLDKDFGAGYYYSIIMENGKIVL